MEKRHALLESYRNFLIGKVDIDQFLNELSPAQLSYLMILLAKDREVPGEQNKPVYTGQRGFQLMAVMDDPDRRRAIARMGRSNSPRKS